jgi:hypothetical protein
MCGVHEEGTMKIGHPIPHHSNKAVLAAPFVFIVLTWLLHISIGLLWLLGVLIVQGGVLWMGKKKVLTDLGTSALAAAVSILGIGAAVALKIRSGGVSRLSTIAVEIGGGAVVLLFINSIVHRIREMFAGPSQVQPEEGEGIQFSDEEVEAAVEGQPSQAAEGSEAEEEFTLDWSRAEEVPDQMEVVHVAEKLSVDTWQDEDESRKLEFDLPVKDEESPGEDSGGPVQEEALTDDWADEALEKLTRVTEQETVPGDPEPEEDEHVGLIYRVLDNDSGVLLGTFYGEEGYTTLDIPTLQNLLPGTQGGSELRIVKVHWANFGEVEVAVDVAGPGSEEEGDGRGDTETRRRGDAEMGREDDRGDGADGGGGEMGMEEQSQDPGPMSQGKANGRGDTETRGRGEDIESGDETVKIPVPEPSGGPGTGAAEGLRWVIYSQRTQRPLADFHPDDERPRLDRLALYRMFKEFEFKSIKIESLRWEEDEIRVYVSGSKKAKADEPDMEEGQDKGSRLDKAVRVRRKRMGGYEGADRREKTDRRSGEDRRKGAADRRVWQDPDWLGERDRRKGSRDRRENPDRRQRGDRRKE